MFIINITVEVHIITLKFNKKNKDAPCRAKVENI